MSYVVGCPNGHQLRVRDELRGQWGKCPQCAVDFELNELPSKSAVAVEEGGRLEACEAPSAESPAADENDYMNLTSERESAANRQTATRNAPQPAPPKRSPSKTSSRGNSPSAMPMPLVGLIMAVLIVAIAMGSTAYYLLTRKPIEEPHPILGAISMPQSSAS